MKLGRAPTTKRTLIVAFIVIMLIVTLPGLVDLEFVRQCTRLVLATRLDA